MRISLAEEIREISQVTPKDFDPDEFHSEPEEHQAAATEHYLLELGCVYVFALFALFFILPVILALPPSARLKTAYRTRSIPDSVYQEHSCSKMIMTTLHPILESRTRSRKMRAERTNQTPHSLLCSNKSPG